MTLDTVDTKDTVVSEHQNGNTCSDARVINVRARAWIWTWNNFEDIDKENMKIWCEKECIEYVFQPEIGENGTSHLQGFWYFKNMRYFNSLKKIWNKIHLEKANNIEAARAYCQKDESKSGETLKGGARLVKDPLEGLTLHTWQTNLLKNLENEPDDRTIVWLYDEFGNCGKTTLAKHLCIKYKDEVLYLSGGPANCKYGITTFLYDKKKSKLIRNEKNLRIAIFDYTRSQDDKVSYQALEEIKNGIFFNTKYESMQVLYNCPHVIVFANFKPDTSKLSFDRWKIININEEI